MSQFLCVRIGSCSTLVAVAGDKNMKSNEGRMGNCHVLCRIPFASFHGQVLKPQGHSVHPSTRKYLASRQESATDFIRFIWYIMEMTGCSYFVLQCRSGFWGLTSFSKADPFTGLGPFNGLGLFNLEKILRRLYDASNNSNRFK